MSQQVLEQILTFSKWEGLANDFIFLAGPVPSQADKLARKLCHRSTGIGADGLVFIEDPPGMVIFNQDGSRASTCGNALRCLGAWYHKQGLLGLDQWLDISTDSGIRRLRVIDSNLVEVDMGRPGQVEGGSDMLPIAEIGFPGYFVSMGNPHLVVLCPEKLPSIKDFERWGAKLSQSLPDGVNVEFVARHPSLSSHLDTLVWERGVGPTQACGSGACAVMVIATRVGWVENDCQVNLPGGPLRIQWNGQDGLCMTGPAHHIFEGTINVSQFTS